MRRAEAEDGVTDWLLRGDPAIRWQVHRDLLDSPEAVVSAEQGRVAREGWGRRLLDLQARDGRWTPERGPAAYRGLYIPKWTSTTYTLLLLTRLGLFAGNRHARAGCRALIDGAEWFPSGGLGFFTARRIAEPCVSAMVLTILERFEADVGARARLERYLLSSQRADGGWNCIEKARHSSFNTTTAALEALERRPRTSAIERALASGREFLLEHRLCRSHRTGRVAKASFTALRWSIGWETDILRQLDHFVEVRAPRDPRLEETIDLLKRRRDADGRWRAARPQPGALHFPLERTGEPSRWITFRCLRAIRWWESGRATDSK